MSARPELERLVKEAVARFEAPEMQRELRRAQRKSWAVGETMLLYPKMTRVGAERLYDQVNP